MLNFLLTIEKWIAKQFLQGASLQERFDKAFDQL